MICFDHEALNSDDSDITVLTLRATKSSLVKEDSALTPNDYGGSSIPLVSGLKIAFFVFSQKLF